MWSAWFERFKTRFVAVTSSEAIEFEAARQIAYVKERLENGFLASANSSRKPFAPIGHGSAQVRSLRVARRSYGAH